MVAFFTNDFQLINIEKTAIIVALGIDKAENEQIEVTAQIAVPQASNQNTTNSDAILSAKEKTLYGALEKISLQTGWYPKLTFCNLILLGSDLIKGDFMPIIDYVLTSNRFQNSAVLAISEKKASDLLKATTPLDYISSFALQKILLRNLDRTSSVLVADVRKLCALSRSHSEFFYMPLIKEVKTQDKSQGSESSGGQTESQSSYIKENTNIYPLISGDGSSSSGGGSSSGQQGSGGQNKPSVFEASSTVLFSKNSGVCIFTKEQTHCYNMIIKQVKETFIPITIKQGEKNINALISVVSNKSKIKLSVDEARLKLKISLTLTCEKEETYKNESTQELAKFNKLSNESIKEVEKKLKNEITNLIELSKSTECDFLQLKELLYRKGNNYYCKFKDNIFSAIDYEVDVVCKNYR